MKFQAFIILFYLCHYANTAEKPNVIVVLADDVGVSNLSQISFMHIPSEISKGLYIVSQENQDQIITKKIKIN